MKFHIYILILISIILTSCQTTKPYNYNLNELTSAKYGGYISIKDKRRNKSFLVNFKAKLFKYDLFRLDVTAPFLGHLASLSVLKNKVQYVIPSERQFYSGFNNSVYLKKILPFELDSKIFFNIFWGTEIKQPGWQCVKKTSGLPDKCSMSAQKIMVIWERKGGVPTKITLSHPKATIQFLVNDFKANYQPVVPQEYVIPNPGY